MKKRSCRMTPEEKNLQSEKDILQENVYES